MTDNRTNELLPCPFCGGEASKRLFYGGKYGIYCDECSARVGGLYDTEAEAIAAWNARAELGSEPPYDELLRCLENDWHIRASWDGLRKFWNIELTEEGVRMRDAMHGTLTAEQVRETVEKHWHDLSADYDMPEATALPECSYDWQAIADELNARAERTCKSTTDDNAWCFVCSECGKSFPRSNLHLAHNHGEINYCPNCGARRVDA